MRLIALTAACAVLIAPATAFACKCAETTQPLAYQRAQVLFEGKVVAVATPEREPTTVRYTFEVAKAWKGAAKGDRVTVITDKAGTCALKLAEGTSYIVGGTDEGMGYPSLKPCHPFHRPSNAKDAEKLRKFFNQMTPNKLASAHGDDHGDEEEESKKPPPPVKKKKKR